MQEEKKIVLSPLLFALTADIVAVKSNNSLIELKLINAFICTN